MVLVFGFLCIILICSLRFNFRGIDDKYLSKDYTQAIKGVFIIIVFMSHIKGYAEFDSKGDLFVKSILQYLGQLMVAYFLFVSGYGVFEAIKKKGKDYIRSFPKNRIAKTFFEFSLAILLFVFLNIFMGEKYSGETTALAFTGWTSIGNSNWYMFAIFTLYIITFVCFAVFERSQGMAIIAVSILSLLYIFIMSDIKENWWSDTYLCYTAGMWFSYFKSYINKIFEKTAPWGWRCGIVLVLGWYLIISRYRDSRLLVYNIVAVSFCLVFVIASMKISFDSRILRWCGKNLFWLYILQRIPMIFLKHYGVNSLNSYFYLLLCVVGTVGLSLIMNRFTEYLMQKTWWG